MSEYHKESQDDVVAFLASPEAHGGAPVRRIDTHAASVFLAGPRVLKVKRAVRFPFLDYSTLAKRKAACEEELRINRPFAPQIYRGVVPITRGGDGSLAIGGDGVPIEWAVDMERFDENLTLDHIAEAGAINPDLALGLADEILAAHMAAPVVPAGPWVGSIPLIVSRNTDAFRRAGVFLPGDIDRLDNASLSLFAHTRELLERRGQQGFVRRCHGDLHLANIVLIDRKPVLFDAIEFDAGIASIDVLYDLAFALMDLLRYRQGAAANSVLNRYLNRSPDENLGAIGLLPLFMSMRAAIRANVLLARLEQKGKGSGAIEQSARAYFKLALDLISPPPPKFIAIGGLSGTGKSELARRLASDVPPQPGAIVLRSDVIRKALFGADETERLPADAYTPQTTAKVYDILAQHAACVLKQGHSVIVDAVFARESERMTMADVARENAGRLVGFFLVAYLDTRIERIRQRSGDASDATPEIALRQQDYDLGHMDWSIVEASGTPEQTFEICRKLLIAKDQVCST
ncbi:MAG: DNA-binding protein [Bradyrhizobiaceae bacterium]|nr:MAG: DNA-binding protein [Bradyrhizobiaceae bacterium]